MDIACKPLGRFLFPAGLVAKQSETLLRYRYPDRSRFAPSRQYARTRLLPKPDGENDDAVRHLRTEITPSHRHPHAQILRVRDEIIVLPLSVGADLPWCITSEMRPVPFLFSFAFPRLRAKYICGYFPPSIRRNEGARRWQKACCITGSCAVSAPKRRFDDHSWH